MIYLTIGAALLLCGTTNRFAFKRAKELKEEIALIEKQRETY